MRTLLSTAFHRILIIAAAAALAIAAWLIVWPASPFRDDSLRRVVDQGVLRVGYAVEPPYAYVDAGGRITGESPELARLVASRMGGLRIDWVQVEFDALIPELESGRFDVVAAGLYITAERARRVRFSLPTLRVLPGLLVRAGNPAGITRYGEFLARDALRVAVIAGAVEHEFFRSRGLAPQRMIVVPDAASGSAAVENGVADALALSLPTVRALAARSAGRLAVVDPGAATPDQGPGGTVAFALRRQAAALAERWDQALAEVLGGPEHLAAIARFGFRAADLARPQAGRAP